MKRQLHAMTSGLIFLLLTCTSHAQEGRIYTLPPEVNYPEGIDYDGGKYIYTAGSEDGVVVRTDLTSGKSTIVAKPGVILPVGSKIFPGILGMRLDGSKRLWLAGGITGKLFVVNVDTGQLIETLTVPGSGSLLNDIVVTPDAVYCTDTLRPTLWKIAFKGGEIGEPEAWINLDGSPIRYQDGPNLNGIAVTPDGKSLLAVQMNTGVLFKIEVGTKTIVPIDLFGESLTGGDGLVLDGSTLYVVRQPEADVVTVELNSNLTSGKVASRFKDANLKWPATAAKAGNELLVVNSQFNKREASTPEKPFSVYAIPLSKLKPH